MGTFPYSVAESISAFLLNPPIGIWNLHWQPKVTSIIIWPNNSTPNSGSKWLNSLIIKKSFNNLNLSLNFESKIIHLRFWLKRGKTMKIHSSLGFKKTLNRFFGVQPPCYGGSSCHYMMIEKWPVHGIHLYTWYMGHFYPSQALDDPTPLALWTREYSTLPKKHKHKLKISVKVGYIRNEEGFLFHDFQMQKSHSTLEICEYWSVDLVCMGVFHLVSTPYPRTRSSN